MLPALGEEGVRYRLPTGLETAGPVPGHCAPGGFGQADSALA